jgi:hypothetical protein
MPVVVASHELARLFDEWTAANARAASALEESRRVRSNREALAALKAAEAEAASIVQRFKAVELRLQRDRLRPRLADGDDLEPPILVADPGRIDRHAQTLRGANQAP